MQQHTIRGSDPIHDQSFQGKTLETSQREVRGSDLTLKMALLKARSGAGTIADSIMKGSDRWLLTLAVQKII